MEWRLIEFNSDTYSVSNYAGSVYGLDETNEIKSKSTYSQSVYACVWHQAILQELYRHYWG